MARFCVLDLAPEAPWRCPDDCRRFEPRTADHGWTHGSLVAPAVEDEPDMEGSGIAALLDEAENVVNAAVPSALAEVEMERRRSRSKWWNRFRRRTTG